MFKFTIDYFLLLLLLFNRLVHVSTREAVKRVSLGERKLHGLLFSVKHLTCFLRPPFMVSRLEKDQVVCRWGVEFVLVVVMLMCV